MKIFKFKKFDFKIALGKKKGLIISEWVSKAQRFLFHSCLFAQWCDNCWCFWMLCDKAATIIRQPVGYREAAPP
jgi:hypothetical protein